MTHGLLDMAALDRAEPLANPARVQKRGDVMRRLWAAGAAIVMCSTLGGAQVAAQGTEASGVTVAMDDCGSLYATPIVCTWTASDPRLTGRMTHEWVILDLGDKVNTVGWADATVEGPEGNWTGRLYAVWKPVRQLFAVLSGDGAYEGWQYVASTIDDGVVGDTDWFGVIYEGELPPYGPLEPTTE